MKTLSILTVSALALVCASCSLDADGSSSSNRTLRGTAPEGTSAIIAYDHNGGIWEAMPDIFSGEFSLQMAADHKADLVAIHDGIAKPVMLQDQYGIPRPARVPARSRPFDLGTLTVCDCDGDNVEDEVVASNDALDDPQADTAPEGDATASTESTESGTCEEGSCACAEGGCDPACCGSTDAGDTGDTGDTGGDVDDGCANGTCACAEGTCDAACCGSEGEGEGEGEGESASTAATAATARAATAAARAVTVARRAAMAARRAATAAARAAARVRARAVRKTGRRSPSATRRTRTRTRT
jgi:hypothetical protein